MHQKADFILDILIAMLEILKIHNLVQKIVVNTNTQN